MQNIIQRLFLSSVLHLYPTFVVLCGYESFLDAFETFNSVFGRCKLLSCDDSNIPASNFDYDDEKVLYMNIDCSFMNIQQHNTVLNENSGLLDSIISNLQCTVTRDGCPLLKEDGHHPALNFECTINVTELNNFSFKSQCPKYNFRLANFSVLYNMISNVDWSVIDEISDIDEGLCEII
ncbi:hypothetical protein JTB14_028668 [Gonioctena quinquepunctata]|nr:hypothetical protein JTB14_028668 [Gonioctena quinquepunctata]